MAFCALMDFRPTDITRVMCSLLGDTSSRVWLFSLTRVKVAVSIYNRHLSIKRVLYDKVVDHWLLL